MIVGTGKIYRVSTWDCDTQRFEFREVVAWKDLPRTLRELFGEGWMHFSYLIEAIEIPEPVDA